MNRHINNLQRFIEAQQGVYERALAEVRRGRKQSHWIWYIFPQLEGLGMSYNAQYYGIHGLDEAKAYLEHPVLGARLREITLVFLHLSGKTAEEVFGGLDAMKVRSCMTLFCEVSTDDLFAMVIEKYYGNKPDEKTLELVNKELSIPVGLGAIAGDIIGSVYEFNPVKSVKFTLFGKESHFTDDTVMTVAVADWLLSGGSLVDRMQDYGRKYPYAGYGRGFGKWLNSDRPQPYHSWGNGSAMRVSAVGWAFDTLEDTLVAAQQSAEVTHNHPEGIKGAQATAACIYWARTGCSKEEIKEYAEGMFGYDLHRTCDEIRLTYGFNESCQGTVPESIIAFLDSSDYEHAIRLAVSLGGDADTMGAITGGIAEAYYGEIPPSIRREAQKRLPEEFVRVMISFYEKFIKNKRVYIE